MPALELRITAPGQKTVEATVNTVNSLAAALERLPKAAAELQRLQRALAGVQMPQGLSKTGDGLKELVGEIRGLGAQLNTSFASLEETIKKGYGRAARATAEGEAQVRSARSAAGAKADGAVPSHVLRMMAGTMAREKGDEQSAVAALARQREAALKLAAAEAAADQKHQANYAKRYALEEQWRIRLQVNSAKMAEAHREAGERQAQAVLAAATRAEAAQARADQRLMEAFNKRYAAEAAARIKIQTNSAQWAEAYRVSQERQAAAQAQARIQLQVNSAKMAEAQREAAEKQAAAEAAARIKIQTNSAQWAEAYRVSQERQAAAQAQARIQLQVNSAKMAEAQREAAEKQAAAEAAARIKIQTNSAQWAEAYRVSQERQAAAQAQARIQLQVNSAKMAEAQREAAEKQAAAEAAARIKIQTNSAQWAEAYRVSQERQAAAQAQARIQLQINSAKMAEAAREAAEKEARAIEAATKKLDAAYAAMNQRAQARAVLRARTQLDQGIAPEIVQSRLGSRALAAAQGVSTEDAFKRVHEVPTQAAPKFKALTAAMNDTHSAARGLASGFGALWLTWGNLGPILAGAAISHSFVQSIKLGAQVRQEFETIRVLSSESAEAVAMLEGQLVELGRNGPFGPQQVATAMRVLSLAGLSAADTARATKPALDLAITGNTTIEKSAESLVAIGTAYGYQAGQFGLVADAVSKAAAISMSSVDGMMESFRSSSVVAQSYKVSLNDTATSLALLANVGIRNSAAGTAMRQMYSELSGASSMTRKAMQQLGVEVVKAEGGMRPLVDIFEDLDAALSKFNAKGQTRAIQDMTNERGAKAFVAVLEALRSSVKQTGDSEIQVAEKVKSELHRIRAEIENAPGFNAIAAAQLAATPLNQMKSVASSFQTALYSAFKEIEPAVIVFSARMREAFNSQEFQQGVIGLVSTLGNFAKMLVDHVGLIKTVVAGYVLWKGATTGLAVAEGIIHGVTVASNGLALATGRATTQTVAATAATTAYRGALTGTAAAAGSAAAGTGMLASRALGVLGPIGMLLGVLTSGWLAYKTLTNESSVAAAEAAEVKGTVVLKSLDDEIARLEAVNKERAAGISLLEAEKRAAGSKARMEYLEPYGKARDAADRAHAAASQAAYSMLQANPALASSVDPTTGRILNRDGASARQINEYADLVTRRINASNDLAAAIRQEAAATAELEQRQRKINELSKKAGEQTEGEKAAAAARAAALLSGQDWSSVTDRKMPPGMKDSLDLQSLQSAFQKRQDQLRAYYDQERSLLDAQHKGKIVSEAEYMARSDLLAEEQYDKQIANLRQFIEQSESLLDRLSADKKRTPQATAAMTAIEAEKRKTQDELNYLLRKAQVDREVAAKKAATFDDTELRKLQQQVALEEQSLNLASQRVAMLPAEIAGEEAKLRTQAAFSKLLDDAAKDLAFQQERLKQLRLAAAVTFETGGTPPSTLEAEEAIRVAEARLAFLKAQRDLLADRSGRTAVEQYQINNRPQWQKNLQDWQDTRRVLEESQNDFMNGWVAKGREAWGRFLKEGKFSAKGFRDLLMDTVADITYKRFIAQPLTQGGNALFDALLKPLATVTPGVATPATPSTLAGGILGATETTPQALRDLELAANDLGAAMQQMGTSLYDLFQQVARGLALMMQQSGNDTLADWGSKLAGWFGGGGGNLTEYNDGSAAAFAKGAAFGVNGIHAFATGGVFANRVVNKPTAFMFGAGGSNLGIMGEAGEEAVMPLERMRNGNLGVRASVGGGGLAKAGNTYVTVENYSSSQATVTESSQPNGDKLIKVVVGEVKKDFARDMATGGPARQAVQGNLKAPTKLPRY